MSDAEPTTPEKELAELCDRYGLPHSATALHTHLVNNRAAVHGIDKLTIEKWKERALAGESEVEKLRTDIAKLAELAVNADFSTYSPFGESNEEIELAVRQADLLQILLPEKLRTLSL